MHPPTAGCHPACPRFPPQSRPYLCTMAVSEAHRRRGHGLALLRAAEVLVGSLGESEIYLHTRQAPPFSFLGALRSSAACRAAAWGCAGLVGLHTAARLLPVTRMLDLTVAPCVPACPACRVQDVPAQLLYAKAGYEEVAADTFLVRLLGLDQRRLLKKRLQR